jgi:hypothetical protein
MDNSKHVAYYDVDSLVHPFADWVELEHPETETWDGPCEGSSEVGPLSENGAIDIVPYSIFTSPYGPSMYRCPGCKENRFLGEYRITMLRAKDVVYRKLARLCVYCIREQYLFLNGPPRRCNIRNTECN